MSVSLSVHGRSFFQFLRAAAPVKERRKRRDAKGGSKSKTSRTNSDLVSTRKREEEERKHVSSYRKGGDGRRVQEMGIEMQIGRNPTIINEVCANVIPIGSLGKHSE